MKASLEKLERAVKTDRACVLIIAIFMLLIAVGLIFEAVSLMSHDPADFTLRTKESIVGIEETSLYIGEEQYQTVFTNNYQLEDDNGDTNYRAMAMIEQIKVTVQHISMAGILLLVYALFRNCKKMRTPFTNRSVWLLRWIAILTMGMGLVPEIISAIVSMVVFSYAIFDIPTASIYILFLGAAFGMIAEIFKYGAVLQDDSDSIA